MGKMIGILLLLIAIHGVSFTQENMETVAERLAQEQLNAYNNRDIDAFLKPFAASVKVFGFPEKPLYQGKEKMKEVYGDIFKRFPDLHCQVVKRIIMNNTVIDQEEVTLKKGEPSLMSIAIYNIQNREIAEMYFILGKGWN